jgi:uncharacterized integral membrane protein
MHIALNGHVFFLILALVLAILAAINVPSTKVNLGWASFACFLIAEFFT